MCFFNLPSAFRAVCSFLSSNSQVSFAWFAPGFNSHSRSRAVCSFLCSSLVSFAWETFVLKFCFSEIRLSFSSGLLLVLKCSSLFRVVCSLFSIPFLRSISRVSFERFASCCQFSSLIQAACSLFSNYQVPFGRSAPCSQILQSSSGSLLVPQLL